MGLKAKVFVVVFMTSCMIQLTICNPIEAKEKDKIAEDPCKLTDLENIPECNKNHTECDEESKIKLEKLHKLCETYPSCKNCETLILESEEELVAPEIVEPIEINLDSTDDLGSPSRRLVERNIIIENDNETQYYRGYVESAANITTVIRLTNLINNTNIINMPTTLNNTNINNIHIYQNKSSETGGKYGLGYSEKGSCCYAVQPRGCMQSTSGLKCRHKRHKVCGRQCTHKVIHPNRNPCTSTQQWPYVLCPPNNGYSNNYNPGYYPPNYPQYYPPNNPQYYPPNNPGYYPQNPVFDQPDDDDDDDFPMFPDEEELNNPESGWIVSPEKCKVVSEDGLQITNCTQKGHDFDNPFARNSISEPSKRNVRQTKKNHHQQIPYPNQMMQQPMQFYPMMYQPVYVQPMPIFMPQFYQQPPLNYPVNNYQPQQIPFPPMDQYDSYEEDQESNKIHEQPKKHFRKNKHVVMEIDEELLVCAVVKYCPVMKSLIWIFFVFVGRASLQDVEVTKDLIIVPLVVKNITDVENEDQSKEIGPETLIDTRNRNFNRQPPCARRQNSLSLLDCEIVEPWIEQEQDSFPIDEPFQIVPQLPVPPIFNTETVPREWKQFEICPVGFIRKGNDCVDSNVQVCQPGYTFTNNRCTLSSTSCPLHFEWDGRSCVQRRICPVNYIWSGGRCILPTPNCPTGWEWNGEVCVIKNIQCDPGSTLRDNKCVIDSFTCPIGSIANGDKCEKPKPVCQHGYFMDSSTGFCIRRNYHCPSGTEMVGDECQIIVKTCPHGTYKHGDNCYPITTLSQRPRTRRPTVRYATTRRSILNCPPGFDLYNRKCYKCPQEHTLCDSKCVRGNDCSSMPPIIINLHLKNDHQQPAPAAGHGYNIVNTIEPINNHINNVNNVTNPVTLNNNNENNIYIYTETKCSDGAIRTVVVKNNETSNGCVDVKEEKPVIDEGNREPDRCCEIVAPRQCRKTHKWICSHRKYNYCGQFCLTDRMYLKPSTTYYQDNIMTVAPSAPSYPSNHCFGRRCPPYDCSGCVNGSAGNCSNQCSSYPCNHAGCHYLSEEDFCSTVGGEICERR